MDLQNDLLVSASEIKKNRLYFVAFKRDLKPRSTTNSHYFSIDHQLIYENFFNDFGPLNICLLYKYCRLLNIKLNSQFLAKKKIIHYTTMATAKRVNAAFLIASYSVIFLGKTPDEAYKPLVTGDIPPYSKFCDASITSNFTITLYDCICAVYKAFNCGFFNFDDFDSKQYEYYERVEHGDLNWIVPDKFIAFCGPHSQSRLDNGYPLHAPETYFNYFKQHNVTTIIRLNVKIYDAARFSNAGFQHKDLYFMDGSTPTDLILKKFLTICEKTPGAVAVHCKAGLGRTGSLIGAYIMKHYNFTALEAISWLRLCRPGSVIGHQQEWMLEKEEWLFCEGITHREKNKVDMAKHKMGIYSLKKKRMLLAAATDNKQVVTASTSTDCIKDRLTRISQKVDSICLNDANNVTDYEDQSITDDDNEIDDDEDNMESDGNANDNKLISENQLKLRGSNDLCAKEDKNIFNIKLTKISGVRDNGDATALSDVTPESEQTQGDKLNQVKAMRRCHQSRGVRSKDDQSSTLTCRTQHHLRVKSQPATKTINTVSNDDNSINDNKSASQKTSKTSPARSKILYECDSAILASKDSKTRSSERQNNESSSPRGRPKNLARSKLAPTTSVLSSPTNNTGDCIKTTKELNDYLQNLQQNRNNDISLELNNFDEKPDGGPLTRRRQRNHISSTKLRSSSLLPTTTDANKNITIATSPRISNSPSINYGLFATGNDNSATDKSNLKRGKRSLSSTRVEKEKSEEKCNKVLRKNKYLMMTSATNTIPPTRSGARSNSVAAASYTTLTKPDKISEEEKNITGNNLKIVKRKKEIQIGKTNTTATTDTQQPTLSTLTSATISSSQKKCEPNTKLQNARVRKR